MSFPVFLIQLLYFESKFSKQVEKLGLFDPDVDEAADVVEDGLDMLRTTRTAALSKFFADWFIFKSIMIERKAQVKQKA